MAVPLLSSSQPHSSIMRMGSHTKEAWNFRSTDRHRHEKSEVPGTHGLSRLALQLMVLYCLAVININNELAELAYMPTVMRVTEIMALDLPAQN